MRFGRLGVLVYGFGSFGLAACQASDDVPPVGGLYTYVETSKVSKNGVSKDMESKTGERCIDPIPTIEGKADFSGRYKNFLEGAEITRSNGLWVLNSRTDTPDRDFRGLPVEVEVRYGADWFDIELSTTIAGALISYKETHRRVGDC